MAKSNIIDESIVNTNKKSKAARNILMLKLMIQVKKILSKSA